MGLGDKMFGGLAWSAIEKLGMQIIQFAITTILARFFLTPKEYGIIGVLLVFIAISKVFVNSGFTQALIQKQNRSEKDITSVFYVNIAISLLCYLLLYLFAPFIANYYNEMNGLEPLLKVLAISLIINSIFTVPSTLLTIALNFKVLTKITLTATILSGAAAIYLAYLGYGVWALVWQQLIRAAIVTILVWFFIKWRPKLIFSINSIKQLFKFGSNLLASSLLNTTVNNFYSLFIGKSLSSSDLGYYTRGTQNANVVFSLVNTTINRVLLPVLSTIQNDLTKLVNHTRKIIRAISVIIVPIFFFLAIMSKPIIIVLLTEKWSAVIPIMQFLCLARLITVISSINVNLLVILGKTNLTLRQQYLKIIVRVIIFLITLKHGIFYIALGELISTGIHFFINTYYPGKIMKYGALKQLKDMRKIVFAGLIMVLPIWGLSYVIFNPYIYLALATILAPIIYILMIRLLKITELNFLTEKAMLFIKPKKDL